MSKLKTFFAVVGFVFVMMIVPASAIRTFNASDIISYADLNANFNHIHNTMVGGHGARLVDADVAANAAITHSKLATPGLLPKAEFIVGDALANTPCTTGTCTLNGNTGAAVTVVHTATGVYDGTWTVARANGQYFVLNTPQCGVDNSCECHTVVNGTTTFTTRCAYFVADGGVHARADLVFGSVLFDDNN